MIKPLHLTIVFLVTLLSWQCSSDENTATTAQEGPKGVQVNQAPPRLKQFPTITAQPVDQARKLSITGRTQPLEVLQIVAEVQGKALKTPKLLNEGIRYKKGETMVNIEDDQFQLDLKAQKSQFLASLVRIMSQIQLDYPAAHPAWDQYLRDFDEHALLPDLPEVTDDQLRYFLSANNVFASFYSIKSAEERLPKYQVKAPFTGIVTQGNVSAGAVINPGVPLATYSRTDVYELKAAISSKDANRFKIGQKITLTHNNTGKRWTGTVNRFGGAMDQGTQSVPVFIRVSGSGLREGMFLEANLETDAYEQVVALPLVALNRNNQVHLIQDSTVQLQDVVPVHYEQNEVWVKGLQGGEQIIIEEIIHPIVGTKAISQS